MRSRRFSVVAPALAVALLVAGCSDSSPSKPSASASSGAHSSGSSASGSSSSGGTATTGVDTVPGMPPVVDATNIYTEQNVGKLDPRLANVPLRVYVPNGISNNISVIDVAAKKVIATYPAAAEPQHIVPSYDLRTLWELNNQGNTLIPIDPMTSTPGTPIAVDDPYNLYFTPDGRDAIIVAEGIKRLDFRDPHTMQLRSSLPVPQCSGVNHADYAADGRYVIFTCEYVGKLMKIDVVTRAVVGYLDLGADARPQDIRAAKDGHKFYVADMNVAGVHIIDGDRFVKTGFVPTAIGAHGLNPSRDGNLMYVANRGVATAPGPPHGKGSVSVLDMSTDKVLATWPIPGGGSPDMGNITPDGKELWLSGRFDSEVYVFDLTAGAFLTRIAVGNGPHGLAVWPQPGRYSLGHTGNMR